MIMTLSEMRQIKEERGYSLAQLSKYSGVPLGTIQKIFSGETIKPRKSTLDAIEKVFLGDESVYQGKAYAYQLESNEQHGDYILVFGHTPTIEYTFSGIMEIWFGNRRIGIDCGSGFFEDASHPYNEFGRLACLRLDDMKEFYSDEKYEDDHITAS